MDSWTNIYRMILTVPVDCRLLEELEGVAKARHKLKLVSLLMEEIYQLVDDPAKARSASLVIYLVPGTLFQA